RLARHAGRFARSHRRRRARGRAIAAGRPARGSRPDGTGRHNRRFYRHARGPARPRENDRGSDPGEGQAVIFPFRPADPAAKNRSISQDKNAGEDVMRRMKTQTLVTLALIALVGAFGLFSSAPVQAQTWPQRPVRFIVPFGPGAGADIGARLFAEKLQAKWGQPVVIENKPGGDSIPAITAFLAANDDHVFLFGPSGNFTVHPFVYSKLPYDPKELIPFARVSNTILAIAIKTDAPYQT